VLSDLPLLHTPGKIALASFLLGLGEVGFDAFNADEYMKSRFCEEKKGLDVAKFASEIDDVKRLLVQVKSGEWGGGKNSKKMDVVKGINKRLKKVRTWAPPTSDTRSNTPTNETRSNTPINLVEVGAAEDKKRKTDDAEGGEHAAKKIKAEPN
jgi:hypothetical protein